MSGLPWDKGYEARLAKSNLNQINVDNIGSYMDEPFTGYESFADEFLADEIFADEIFTDGIFAGLGTT